MADNDTRACKQAAVQFLQLVAAGRIDEAYQKHVDMQGKHHNPFFPAGFPALRKAMNENHVQFPDKQLTVKNVLGVGDLGLCTPTSYCVQVRQAWRLSTCSVSAATKSWRCGTAASLCQPIHRIRTGYFNKHDEANSFPIRFHTCGTYIRNYPGSAHLLLFRFLAQRRSSLAGFCSYTRTADNSSDDC
ncbi:hypothetical protein GPROT1_00049 [Gammaproteobacteria bacterium]|nr:hypothetical protein GPROT1_00049 [Gammaproteobacteria bacterium]